MGAGGSQIRTGLVLFQFAITVFLLSCTAVIFDQLKRMRSWDPAFEKKQVLIVEFHGDAAVQRKHEEIKTAFISHPGVIAATAAAGVPGRFYNTWNITVTTGSGDEIMREFHVNAVDEHFVETLQLRVIAGRDLSPTDGSKRGILLNESAVRLLDWGEPADVVGRRLSDGWPHSTIVGVVRDFHHYSLHHPIQPYFLHRDPQRYSCLAVRIDPTDVAATLLAMESDWRAMFPGRPFEYFFLDEDFDRQHNAEMTTGVLFSGFSGLAIAIGCLGLVGLMSFAVERRTKEVGVRKILGASEANVMRLLTRDFVVPVLFANLIAWPLAYLALDAWLETYAYRVDINLFWFALAGTVALVIAMAAVSGQTWRSAHTNPVQALRSE